MQRILRYLGGYTVCTVTGNESAVYDALLGQNATYWNVGFSDGTVSFSFFTRHRKNMERLLDKIPDTVYNFEDKGFPACLRRYRARPGILCGLLLFCGSLWFSSLFIWDVRISGNTTVEDGYLRESLAAYGCKTGAFYPSLDFYELSTRYLQEHDELCWLSVNRKGNIAYVEVLESEPKPEHETSDAPANIIASASGVVTAVYVYGGDAVVKTGDSVSAGQVLISGFTMDRFEDIRLVRASGEVLAQIRKTFTVTVPYNDVRRSYDGEQTVYRTASLFGMTLPLYFGEQREMPDCDRLSATEPLYLTDWVRTPVLLTTDTYAHYVTLSFTRTRDQCRAEALRRMEEVMREGLEHCETVSVDKTESDGTDEGGEPVFILRYEVTCIADIAQVREIAVPQS